MTIAQLKRDCSDCRKTHRWAEVRSDFEPGKYTQYRIIGIGRKYVRVMSGGGTIFNAKPEDIRKAW